MKNEDIIMTESIIGISVPMLESTLMKIKQKAGTNETKKAISIALEAYLDETRGNRK